MAKRRASAHLTLVLIGSVTLAGCSDPTDQRDLYANRGDCVRDWGDDDKKCEQGPPRSGSSGGHYYYGPRHITPSTTQLADGSQSPPRPGSHAIATAHVSRGGFGSSGGHHSGGG